MSCSHTCLTSPASVARSAFTPVAVDAVQTAGIVHARVGLAVVNLCSKTMAKIQYESHYFAELFTEVSLKIIIFQSSQNSFYIFIP